MPTEHVATTQTAKAQEAKAQTVKAQRGNSRTLFIITILTGSFLLFLVQPMVARMVLPRLGGAPAVWNSAMVVYQALLLAGYAYAHALARFAPKTQAAVHISVFLLAAFWLPLGLANLQMPNGESPIFWVPWLLIASIGPLFFAVAAQAPLMQRWYNLAGNDGEPYALYAASNIGSFAGLIAYPIIVEPLLPLQSQNGLWTILFAVLALLVAACAFAIWKRHGDPIIITPIGDKTPISWKTRLYWIALAAVPSGLMLSTTTHITTDLVAIPLIWVVPLGLYLLSFTIAFADNRRIAHFIVKIAPVLILILGVFTFPDGNFGAIKAMVISLTLLFIIAVALHSEIYAHRPKPEQLTDFYLMMSVGGVIGGIFCAIIAPLIFNWNWEHPILILAAALLLPASRNFLAAGSHANAAAKLGLYGIISAIILAAGVYIGITVPVEMSTMKIVILAALGILGLFNIGNRILYCLVLAIMLFANGGSYNIFLSLSDVRMRSYFGTYTINSSTDGGTRWLFHGTTMHGMQVLGDPTRRISYYGPHSGVGMAMERAQEYYGPMASIGVVGLGAGTLSCYSKPEQKWQFFEIDPLVVAISKSRHIFSYLDLCAPSAQIYLGDARLTVSKVPAHSLDILVVDAFSSDAIPLHLMTKEAFAVYARALRPGGLLLVHISNNYIDLNPVVSAQAKAMGWHGAIRNDHPSERASDLGYRPSNWIALSDSAARLRQLTGDMPKTVAPSEKGDVWSQLDDPKRPAWSDDFSSVLPYLKIWGVKK